MSQNDYCAGYQDGALGSRPKDSATLHPWPGLYAIMYQRLVEVAREHGYALAVHGTMARDLDLVAVPWIAGAADPLVLMEALRARVGGVGHNGWPLPTAKPHGRQCWCIHLGGGPYIDVSVMPRAT